MRPSRLLARLHRGDLANVHYTDFRRLVEAVDFRLIHIQGSHHIYRHPEAPALLNLQDVGRVAKPYQIRQFLRTMNDHDLTLEELE